MRSRIARRHIDDLQDLARARGPIRGGQAGQVEDRNLLIMAVLRVVHDGDKRHIEAGRRVISIGAHPEWLTSLAQAEAAVERAEVDSIGGAQQAEMVVLAIGEQEQSGARMKGN